MRLFVAGIDDAIALEVHVETACVIRSDRTVWCWGVNSWGEAGEGANPTDGAVAYFPQRINVVEDARLLGMGSGLACAAEGSGDIWCWGWEGSDSFAPFRVKL